MEKDKNKKPNSQRDKVQHVTGSKTSKDATSDKDFPGYPHYPPSEDIFRQERELDTDVPKNRGVLSPSLPGDPNEKDFLGNMTGEDLDVPGNTADESKDNAGNEDEENNYYSLGGDRHNDLEEDKG